LPTQFFADICREERDGNLADEAGKGQFEEKKVP
jgi:hypothetical protein